MKTCFAALGTNKFSRKFGGTTYGVADPYISGYGFIHFSVLPPNLATYVKNAGNNDFSNAEITSILSAACLSVTPPGGTLNKVEFSGLGGVKWAVPTNIDYGNSVSMKFLEFNHTPILDIFHGWVRMIRDYRLGISNLEDSISGATYSNTTYSAVVFYWTTAPDGRTIEYYACYDGLFPNKDPQDLYSFDIENIGKLEVEIEFNVDYMWREPWVYNKCKSLQDAFTANANVVAAYGSGY